ncbi:MAG: hypothetical protein VYA99_10195 [Pseudomonadota bacterium]|nr:hypothetical protein [Pseudomonadota bacterium]
MNIHWRERLEQTPNLRDIASWAAQVPDQLPARYRRQYARNRSVVARVLAGEKIVNVAREHGLSPGRVCQIMSRCLGGDDAASPALATGLLPHVNVNPTKRRLPLPALHSNCGAQGAFRQLLHQAPGLADSLDQMLRARLVDSPQAQTHSVRSFHGEFKRFLAATHWPQDLYPYTTEQCAYESVRQYYHQRLAALKAELQQRRKRNFADKRSPINRYAGRAVQIDEQVVDLKTSLHLSINGVQVPIALPRISVLVAIDVDTGCVLAIALALTQHPTEEDLLGLLQSCVTPRPLPALTSPGLEYTLGSNFPCNIENAIFQFSAVHLDNAWMHHSRAVTDWICRKMGATVHFGLPAQPTVRAEVERVFNLINKQVTHRPASTTGSHPADPNKASAKQTKKLPLTTLQNLDEMLLVVLTDYNVTPRPALGGMTPLNCVIEHARLQCGISLPEVDRLTLSVNIDRETVVIHRPERRGVPYINFCYAKYYGECLSRLEIIGKQITIEFDRGDIRFLKAYLPSGEFLGNLRVSTSWLSFPHNMKLRKKAHKDVRAFKLHKPDKLAAYFHLQLTELQNQQNMLEVAKLHKAFTGGRFTPINLDKPNPAEVPNDRTGSHSENDIPQSAPPTGKKFLWTTKGASHVSGKG